MIRYSPKTGEPFELIREFTGAGRYVVAVVREVNGGRIYNVPMRTFEEWTEADA